MENWQKAAEKFIAQCEFRSDIEAVFLTGSYAAGNADAHSDVDLYIVLNDAVSWRERGNKRVDGVLIEYFANPLKQIKGYIDFSCAGGRLTEINMILSGIVLLDQNNTAEQLRKYCLEKRAVGFPELSEFQIKSGLYAVRDDFDELSRAYQTGAADFATQYHMFIINAFAFYSRYIRSPIPGHHHLLRWLENKEYQDRFGLPPYGDAAFAKTITEAFYCEDIAHMYAHAGKIKEYILNQLGGFDVAHFVLRSECTI